MNAKGQVLVETLVASSFALFFCFKLIHVGLMIRYEIVFDDMIEEALICKFQKEDSCILNLKNKLSELHFSEITVSDQSQNRIAKISVSAKTKLNSTFTKQSELSLDLSIP